MYKKPKVVILLAVYNGGLWLEQQISSILNQNLVDVTIFISVDLSTDESLSLCEGYTYTYNNIHILPYGERFGGAAPNFYRLIADVDLSDFDYISLADQDDIWNHDKITNAISIIKSKKIDGYSSNVTAFWPDGRKKIINKSQPQVQYDYIFEPAGPGCTYVLSNKLANDFKKFIVENSSRIGTIDYHDWLIYAFARSNKFEWYIDDRPSMLYRQHEKNQIGASAGISAQLKRFSLVQSKWYRNQVLKIFSVLNLVEENTRISSILSKEKIPLIQLAFIAHQCRRRFRDKLLLAILCVLGFF
jgi:rhamnosyltransferase